MLCNFNFIFMKSINLFKRNIIFISLFLIFCVLKCSRNLNVEVPGPLSFSHGPGEFASLLFSQLPSWSNFVRLGPILSPLLAFSLLLLLDSTKDCGVKLWVHI